LTLVPQIHFIGESLSIPYSIRFVIAIAIMVLLMTYFIMPLLTKVLRPWLFNS
jgi:antibiotic biosynthesis monooxygenase (ABM) superfamily enzyme